MMEDLDKLIEAVEGGTATEFQFLTWRPSLTGARKESATMQRAYHGSLDAAMALHESLLPGWDWGRDPNGFSWVSFKTQEFGATDHIDNPSRAWLIAILKAYRSTQGETA